MLHWCVVDTDRLVEAKAGMSVANIFEQQGEEAFRRLEAEVVADLQKLSAERNQIVATGGGLPVFSNNLQKLAAFATVIYLTADMQTLAKRIDASETRPLIKSQDADNALQRLQRLVADRTGVYEQARYKIDTTCLTPRQVAEHVVRSLAIAVNGHQAV